MTIDFDSFTTEPRGADRPQRRAVAVVGAAMLVAAAGGVGFGLGRSGGSESASTDVAEIAPAQEAPGGTESLGDQPRTVETVLATGNDSVAPGAATELAGEASGGGGYAVFGNQPTELIAERITDSGITLRAHLGEIWDQSDYLVGEFGTETDWTPPGWCFESGQVRIAMSGGTATGSSVIDVGTVSWWTEPFQGRAVSWLTLGVADGNPHRVVFVQAPVDVTTVTVTHADGSTDSTAPIGGVALLVVPGGPATTQHDEDDGYTWTEEVPDFDVTFDGPEPVTIADAHQNRGWDDLEFRQSCQPPPPALPAPGEQPADPAAAEATIVETMATIYSVSDSEANAELIDDPTGP
jgi:hypothetical protein